MTAALVLVAVVALIAGGLLAVACLAIEHTAGERPSELADAIGALTDLYEHTPKG